MCPLYIYICRYIYTHINTYVYVCTYFSQKWSFFYHVITLFDSGEVTIDALWRIFEFTNFAPVVCWRLNFILEGLIVWFYSMMLPGWFSSLQKYMILKELQESKTSQHVRSGVKGLMDLFFFCDWCLSILMTTFFVLRYRKYLIKDNHFTFAVTNTCKTPLNSARSSAVSGGCRGSGLIARVLQRGLRDDNETSQLSTLTLEDDGIFVI